MRGRRCCMCVVVDAWTVDAACRFVDDGAACACGLWCKDASCEGAHFAPPTANCLPTPTATSLDRHSFQPSHPCAGEKRRELLEAEQKRRRLQCKYWKGPGPWNAGGEHSVGSLRYEHTVRAGGCNCSVKRQGRRQAHRRGRRTPPGRRQGYRRGRKHANTQQMRPVQPRRYGVPVTTAGCVGNAMNASRAALSASSNPGGVGHHRSRERDP